MTSKMIGMINVESDYLKYRFSIILLVCVCVIHNTRLQVGRILVHEH